MATQIRRPTGSSSSGVWTITGKATSYLYEAVNETSYSDAEYITLATTSGGWADFTFTAFDISTTYWINKVTVYYRDKAADTNARIAAYVQVNGTKYYSPYSGTPGGSFATQSYDWTTNPETGLTWTEHELESDLTSFGIISDDSDPNVSCSWTYIEVTYDTVSPSPSISASPSNSSSPSVSPSKSPSISPSVSASRSPSLSISSSPSVSPSVSASVSPSASISASLSPSTSPSPSQSPSLSISASPSVSYSPSQSISSSPSLSISSSISSSPSVSPSVSASLSISSSPSLSPSRSPSRSPSMSPSVSQSMSSSPSYSPSASASVSPSPSPSIMDPSVIGGCPFCGNLLYWE